MDELRVLSGLGNRLITMVTAAAMDAPPRRVVWNPQPFHCPCKADRILDVKRWPFEVRTDRKATDKTHPYVQTLRPVRPTPRRMSGNSVFAPEMSPARMARAAAQRIRPSPAVAARVRAIDARVCLRRCVGVHVRRTDKAERCERASPLAKMITDTRRALRKGEAIVLATDDRAVVAAFRKAFPGVRVTRPTADVGRDNVEGAMVDLVCLSRCRAFVGTVGSTFSFAAQLMRGPRVPKTH